MFLGRPEGLSKRIGHQMQLMVVDAALRLVVADIDDADVNEVTRQERPDPYSRLWIEDVERVMHHDPKRLLQEDAGKGQALLLVVGQLPVPSVHGVEQGLEAFQSNGGERLGYGGAFVGVSRVRIGDGLTQTARRDVGADRHEHDGLTGRVRNAAVAPRPEPADGAKQQGFLLAIFAGD